MKKTLALLLSFVMICGIMSVLPQGNAFAAVVSGSDSAVVTESDIEPINDIEENLDESYNENDEIIYDESDEDYLQPIIAEPQFELLTAGMTQREAIVAVAQAEYNSYGGTTCSSRPYNTGAWCARFVSWCARQAGISESILRTSVWASPKDTVKRSNGETVKGFNIPYYSVAEIKAGKYWPRPGDLIFYDWTSTTNPYEDPDWDHVGLVVGTDGNKIISIEGNTGGGLLKKKTNAYNWWDSTGGPVFYGAPNYSDDTAPITSDPIAEGVYRIKNYGKGTYLTVSGNTDQNNTNIGVASYDNLSGQRFYVYKYNGSYAFRPECTSNSRVVNVSTSGSAAHGNNVMLWDRTNNASQLWTLEEATGSNYGRYYICSTSNTNVLLDTNGNDVRVYNKSGTAEQMWMFEPVDVTDIGTDFYARIVNVESKNPIASKDGNAELSTHFLNFNTFWKFTRYDDGTYLIKDIDGKALDVASEKNEIRTNIQTWEVNNSSAQRWMLKSTSNGYILQAKMSDYVMDADQGSSADGTNVRTYTKNNTAAQTWIIEKNQMTMIPTKTVCYNGHIYSLYDNATTWEEARRFCERVNGHLATITSEEEQQVIASLLGDNESWSFWLGGTDVETEGSWKWITGEPFSYSNWHIDAPDNYNNVEDYMVIYDKKDKTWNDRDGEFASVDVGFICEVETSAFTPAASTTYNGSRYELYNNRITWCDAKAYAESIGGHLVTIGSAEENKAVSDLCASNGDHYRYWLGATSHGSSTFKWVTNESFTYNNWAENEPSNSYGREYFAQMYNNESGFTNGTWNDYRNMGYADEGTGFVVEFDRVEAASIILSRTSLSLSKDTKATLIAVVAPADSTEPVVWTTSDSAVATVSGGTVTAITPGTCTITATAGNLSAVCTVTVTLPTTAITIDKINISVNKGATAELVATVTPADTTDTVTWTTSDSAVATVSDGTVTAIAPGTCVITATAGGLRAMCTVTVTSPATEIILDKTSISINKGDIIDLIATVAPSNTTDTVIWTTSNNAIATVSGGTVTAIAPGTCTITATAGSVKATCTVTVKPSATAVDLDKTSIYVNKGETAELTATVTPANANGTLIWTSSDNSVATVSDGTVTAVAPGTCTITVTTGSVSAVCTVTVKSSATSITLASTSLSVNKGETVKLSATITPDDTTDTVVWTTSDNAVATVSDGTVTAIAGGTCTITATAGSVKATCTITVNDPNILPAPTTFTVARASINSIKLTWSAVSGASGYYVYRSTDGTSFSKVKTLASSTKTFTDTKLTCGKTYYYKVAAYSKAKVTGTFSAAMSAKPYPNTPSKLTAKCSSNYKIAVKWGAVSGVTGYKLYRSVNGGEYKLYKTLKAKTYTDTSVVPGVSYSYKVTAYKGSGESKLSGAKSSKTKLPAPGSFKVKKSAAGKIKLTWKKVTGASGYKVYRYNVDTAAYECIATLSGNGKVSYTNSGLVKGTTYKYKVYAYRTAGGLTGLGTATGVKSAKA